MYKAEILLGDVRERLAVIPDGTARTCVTSPPYWGLRDYGHEGQIGLEDSVTAYVEELVEVFRQVRRVLTEDGTFWLNLGDSYGKGKQLVGVPWRVAFGLQADGWYLRQDIIWSKPNPMPESVTDRCTKAHEYVFLLSKSPKYFFDNEAIKEPLAESSLGRLDQDIASQSGSNRAHAGAKTNGPIKAFGDIEGGRNKRSVWSITTKPFKGAHFAVMPEALVEPCILAGSEPGDTVLDPFSGAATVGVVATRLERHYIGCELNPEYARLSEDRLIDEGGMFVDVTVIEKER